MKGNPHLSWLPDVFSASRWEREVATALAAYATAQDVHTAQDLAWALNSLANVLGGVDNRARRLAAVQSAVAVLRHEVDNLAGGHEAPHQPARDLVYLLGGLAAIRLDSGLPEASLRALDEGIAHLTLAMLGKHPPDGEDRDLLGSLLETRATAHHEVVLGGPDVPLAGKTARP